MNKVLCKYAFCQVVPRGTLSKSGILGLQAHEELCWGSGWPGSQRPREERSAQRLVISGHQELLGVGVPGF